LQQLDLLRIRYPRRRVSVDNWKDDLGCGIDAFNDSACEIIQRVVASNDKWPFGFRFSDRNAIRTWRSIGSAACSEQYSDTY
jgi:hypothetical protein